MEKMTIVTARSTKTSKSASVMKVQRGHWGWGFVRLENNHVRLVSGEHVSEKCSPKRRYVGTNKMMTAMVRSMMVVKQMSVYV